MNIISIYLKSLNISLSNTEDVIAIHGGGNHIHTLQINCYSLMSFYNEKVPSHLSLQAQINFWSIGKEKSALLY